MAKHYHVNAGSVGCLPDGEPAIFMHKTWAEDYAKQEAAAYREAGYRVTGNVKTGYAIDPINYLEVVSCEQEECLKEHWDF